MRRPDLTRGPGAPRLVAAISVAALIAGCAQQTPPVALPPPPATFSALDDDADGTVTVAEWEDHGNDLFAQIDTDGDGQITEAEFLTGHAALDSDKDGVLTSEEADIEGLDVDGDGVISEAEWQTANPHARLDANSDGLVTAEEIRVSRARTFRTIDLDGNSSLSISETGLEQDRDQGFTVLRF